MKLIKTLFIVSPLFFGATQSSLASEPIAPGQVSKFQALIKPQPGEDRWAAIPWLTDMWQARQIAARQGRPILLWEMDGHPLGCT